MESKPVTTIKPMRVTDLPEIQVIERAAFTTPWSYESFLTELLNNDNAHYLTAVVEGKVVGYVGVWIILDEGHITNVAVARAYQGQGIGRALLEEIAKYARDEGVVRMTLEVRVSNRVAQHLYGKLGYKPSGIRPGYYRDNNEDALIMWKELLDDEQNDRVDVGD